MYKAVVFIKTSKSFCIIVEVGMSKSIVSSSTGLFIWCLYSLQQKNKWACPEDREGKRGTLPCNNSFCSH